VIEAHTTYFLVSNVALPAHSIPWGVAFHPHEANWPALHNLLPTPNVLVATAIPLGTLGCPGLEHCHPAILSNVLKTLYQCNLVGVSKWRLDGHRAIDGGVVVDRCKQRYKVCLDTCSHLPLQCTIPAASRLSTNPCAQVSTCRCMWIKNQARIGQSGEIESCGLPGHESRRRFMNGHGSNELRGLRCLGRQVSNDGMLVWK